jgi:hypothetical protein
VRRLAACLAALSWLSLAEWKIFERLLYGDAPNVGFVLESVRGVLAGTPVSKSWQHRFLGPLLVSALARVTGQPLTALELFAGLLLFGANLLLFVLLRRRGASLPSAMLAVVCFGFAHIILAYRLEYQWDWIDILIFLWFGYWAARGGGLLALAPLLVVGTFNHETVLYLPLWYLLGKDRRQQAGALATAAGLGTVIVLVRSFFYKGRPVLPGQVFEPVTPLISNHIHVSHNLGALLVWNWIAGRTHISLLVLSAVALLVWLAARRPDLRQPAVWSLCILATIVCFGYTNETRHYLLLVAFWFAYAWPPMPEGLRAGLTAA